MNFTEFKDKLDEEAMIIKRCVNTNDLGNNKSDFFDNGICASINNNATTLSNMGIKGLSNKSGIYVFAVEKDFIIDVKKFNSVKNAAKLQPFDNNKHALKKGDIFYVGEAKNISSRMSLHLAGDAKGKGAGLRLSSDERKEYRENLKLYIFKFKEDLIKLVEQGINRRLIENKIKTQLNPCCGT